MSYSDGHLANIGRSLGVPYDLREDLMQELRLFLWQKPDAAPWNVRTRAIDFLRREGPHSRSFDKRTRELKAAESLEGRDFTAISDWVLDYQSAWHCLTPTAQRAIMLAFWGAPYNHYATECRRKARRLAGR